MNEDNGRTAGVRPARRPGPQAPPPFPSWSKDPGAGVNLCFDLLAVGFGWLVHPFWLLASLVLIAFAAEIVVNYWSLVLSELRFVWRNFAFLPMLLGSMVQSILILNLPHVLLTGVGCRVFGGRIRSVGLLVYGGLIPLIHVDLGDSVSLMKGPNRMTFLWWNILFPLICGALYVIAWAVAGPGSSASRFWLLMFAPAALAFLLECNIFLRTGLYWVLCSAVGEWRLHERALAETHAWLDWGRAPEPLNQTQRFWFRFYGISYWIYRILLDLFVLVGVGYWFIQAFSGVTLWVYPALVLWWYRDALGRALMAQKPVRWVVRGGGPWWLRWPLRLAGLAGLVGLGFIRYNYEIAGECRLVPAAQYGVRAQLTDEIVQLHVAEGDEVQAGTVIATLSARSTGSDYRMTQHELEMARADLELLVNGPRKEDIQIASDQVEIRQNQLTLLETQLGRTATLYNRGMASTAQIQQAREERDNAQLNLLAARQELSKLKVGYREEAIRSAQAKVRRLEEKLKYDEQMLKLTQLTTPIAGRVITPHLDVRRGLQAKGGDLIAVIQDTSSLCVEVSADEAAAVDVRKGMVAKVRLYGLDSGRLLTGRVRGLAMAAEADSKFAIDAFRSDPEIENEQYGTSGDKNDQRVRVYVELDEYPPELVPGMVGYARIVSNRNDLLWRALARPIVRFLRTDVWYWLP